MVGRHRDERRRSCAGPPSAPHLRLVCRRLPDCGGGRRQLRLARRLPVGGARTCAGCCRRRHDDPRLGADHGSSGRRTPRHRRPAPGRARLPAGGHRGDRGHAPPGPSPYLQRRTCSPVPHRERGWPPRADLSMYGVNRRGPAASPCSSWRPCPWRKCPKWRPASASSELHLKGRPGLQSIRGGERL